MLSSYPSWLWVAAPLPFVFFDVFWFLRLAYVKLVSLFSEPISVRDGGESVLYSFCAPTDVDYFCHMNNGRYHREMDFGRFDFYFRGGLSRHLSRMSGVHVVQHASMIRFRRSIDFLQPYKLVTKLVWFDERSLYFEQRFVTLRDGFIRTVALCKNTAVNCDIPKLMLDEFGLERPSECPPVVAAFLETQQISSKQLLAEVKDKEESNLVESKKSI